MAEKKQAPLNTLLTIYFYHTRLTRESYEEWKEYKFPGHILYGLPLLENYGIHSVMHKCKYFSGRLKLMFYATKEILFCKEKYDVLYATSFRGIEPVIFLRALGLYRKPIVIWHHTAVVTNPKPWREQISRLFYKGIDQMFLFSRKLIQDSQKPGKLRPTTETDTLGPDLPSTTICCRNARPESPKDLSPPAKRTGTWTPCSSLSPQQRGIGSVHCRLMR